MTAKNASGELRPLRDDLFALNDQGMPVALNGTRCVRCREVTFPARAICNRCGLEGQLAPHRLSTRGIVHASTVVRVPSSLGHKPPYAYGYVDLPGDGTRIFAPFSGADVNAFPPGRRVRLAVGEIPAASMAGILGYSFVPDPQEAFGG